MKKKKGGRLTDTIEYLLKKGRAVRTEETKGGTEEG